MWWLVLHSASTATLLRDYGITRKMSIHQPHKHKRPLYSIARIDVSQRGDFRAKMQGGKQEVDVVSINEILLDPG